MQNWINFFDKIYVINLAKRTDRLLQIAEELERYNIPFELVTATEQEDGAEGLKTTMQGIFKKSIEKRYESILVFEDDAYFVEGVEYTNEVLNNAMDQLPKYWDMLLLGGQPVMGFSGQISPNLLSVEDCYATHSVAYSINCMKRIMALGMESPIDNWLVKHIQTQKRTYITYPLLASQRAGISDIGKAYIDWNPFIINKYNQKLNEL
jgi:hypothetical protein